MKSKTRSAPPRAMAMLESLRGLGYSTGAALADIIDNSISAGADEVRLEFVWAGSGSRITILDNGRGMNDAELESAMRLGDKNPLDARSAHDLGRFGMGLKTASLSQCRRLTVASVIREARDRLGGDADRGLLLLYTLAPYKGKEKCPENLIVPGWDKPIMAFAIAFPSSENGIRVEYAVNLLYWLQEYGPSE